jgi:hypothetical protein
MKSYKQWKMVNEAVFPTLNLGISHPQTIGGLRSNMPGVGELSEKKKMSGKVVVDEPEVDDTEDSDEGDHDCSCDDKKDKQIAFSKKNMKKKMKKKMTKKMEDELEDDLSDDDVGEEDDVNDVETPDDDHDDDHDEEGDDHDEDDHEEGDGEEDDHHDEEDDAPKFGFMKDKKGKKKDKKKEKEKVEESFWNDIERYHVPKANMETEKEFFDSLARQYGNPKTERYSSGVQGDGVNEDLLLTPDQEALINSMPNPGEVGYSPSHRLGGFASSEQPELATVGEDTDYEDSVEDSVDYKVLCKYVSENVARKLIKNTKE